MCFHVFLFLFVPSTKIISPIVKVEERLQIEFTRNHDGQFTAVHLGYFLQNPSPSSHREFKYIDLNSVCCVHVQKVFHLTILSDSIPPLPSASHCDSAARVRPIIHRRSYLSAPLGKQGKSSGGWRDKCPFFTQECITPLCLSPVSSSAPSSTSVHFSRFARTLSPSACRSRPKPVGPVSPHFSFFQSRLSSFCSDAVSSLFSFSVSLPVHRVNTSRKLNGGLWEGAVSSYRARQTFR